eukprot:TRINITY_DN1396_c0_g2_i1.p1 TRINITY_DN1396_c0_g2~~TRINITY_DN1396_c0_g2_i1.p1  ORF type:complete len:285 (+),score=25.23 TRINITY_DN1396_c0_g2_i1:23-877(+)
MLCYRSSSPRFYDYVLFFFNDTATTEIYTILFVGSVRCVQETDLVHQELSFLEKIQQELTQKQQHLLNPNTAGNTVCPLWHMLAHREQNIILLVKSLFSGKQVKHLQNLFLNFWKPFAKYLHKIGQIAQILLTSSWSSSIFSIDFSFFFKDSFKKFKQIFVYFIKIYSILHVQLLFTNYYIYYKLKFLLIAQVLCLNSQLQLGISIIALRHYKSKLSFSLRFKQISFKVIISPILFQIYFIVLLINLFPTNEILNTFNDFFLIICIKDKRLFQSIIVKLKLSER